VPAETLLAFLLGKLGPPLVKLIGQQVISGLSPNEEERLQKALKEAMLDASGSTKPKGIQKATVKIGAMTQWLGSRFRRKSKTPKPPPPGAMPAAPPSLNVAPEKLLEMTSGVGETDEEGAINPWHIKMAKRFAALAKKGLEQDEVAWTAAIGGLSTTEWGTRVQQGLEWRMATDRKLRPILGRLDWTSEQGYRSGMAVVAFTFMRWIPIVLALAAGILLALVAIAVILAV